MDNQEDVKVLKRGRGRPRKVVKFDIPPEIQEEVEAIEAKPIQVKAMPAFTEIVNLSGGLDLEDLAKTPELEAEPEVIPEPPVAPMQSFSFSSLSPSIFTQPPPVEESEEDRILRASLMGKLKRYATEFPAFAQPPPAPDASLHTLRTQLDEVRGMIQNKTTAVLIKRAYLTSVSTLEIFGKKTRTANLDGLADLMARSSEVDECLKQISCEIDLGYISPIKKLAFITVSSAYILNTMNAKAKVFEEFGKENVKADTLKTFADL